MNIFQIIDIAWAITGMALVWAFIALILVGLYLWVKSCRW